MGFEPMHVRAVIWAFLGIMSAGIAGAAERPAAPPAADSYPVATEVRLGGDDSQTRFVMDLSRKIDLHAFTLADPYRVVVDIPEVTFQLVSKTGETGRGLIKAFRYGLMMPGGSRLVFDLTKPVHINKAVPADTAPAGTSEVNKSDPRPLVALDPGHGGPDTGTRGPAGELEKDIVLDFAQRLRGRIEKAGKYRVLMTRSDDTFIPLPDRVRIARNAGAALFVSIHADSLPKKEG